MLNYLTKNYDSGYDRLPENNVNVTSCSSDLGDKNGFTGSAVTPTVLKIEENVQDKEVLEIGFSIKLLSRNF